MDVLPATAGSPLYRLTVTGTPCVTISVGPGSCARPQLMTPERPLANVLGATPVGGLACGGVPATAPPGATPQP